MQQDWAFSLPKPIEVTRVPTEFRARVSNTGRLWADNTVMPGSEWHTVYFSLERMRCLFLLRFAQLAGLERKIQTCVEPRSSP